MVGRSESNAQNGLAPRVQRGGGKGRGKKTEEESKVDEGSKSRRRRKKGGAQNGLVPRGSST